MSGTASDRSKDRWRAGWRVPALVGWTVILVVPSVITRLVNGRASMAVISLWHRGCCRLLGLDVRAVGLPSTEKPVLFVANHVSYLDILVLGGLLDARFIAKSDVRAWPGIGPLAALAGTIFVERRARKSRQQRDVIGASLAEGDSLILFPEGTSSDGSRVLPFKSSLFSVIEKGETPGLAIQPVTIDYTRFGDGRPIEGEERDLYAWYGDMTLAPHLGRVVGLPGAEVRVVWHEVIRPTPSSDRKALARLAEGAVADGLDRLRGRTAAQEDGLTAASVDAA